MELRKGKVAIVVGLVVILTKIINRVVLQNEVMHKLDKENKCRSPQFVSGETKSLTVLYGNMACISVTKKQQIGVSFMTTIQPF